MSYDLEALKRHIEVINEKNADVKLFLFNLYDF
jgi:hypothetical protein